MPRIKKIGVLVVASLCVNLYLLHIDPGTQRLRFSEVFKLARRAGNIINETWQVVPSECPPAEHFSDSVIADLEKKFTNLPVDFAQRNQNRNLCFFDSCACFPSLWDIHYNNDVWQTLTTTDGVFYFYAAYYDNRVLLADGPVVRITSIISCDKVIPATVCQLWFDEQDKPEFSDAIYEYLWQSHWFVRNMRGFRPYLISCPIPKSHSGLVPRAVSLVEHPCDSATNALRVLRHLPDDGVKEDFAVCLKGSDFYYQNYTERLVEWLEVLSLMGANKVFYYDFGMNDEMARMMKYYEEKGLVEVLPVTLPGSQPNIPGMYYHYVKCRDEFQHEVIQYQDCYYRNIHRYKYTVHLDHDELIVPRNVDTWQKMMRKVLRKANKDTTYYTSYCSREVFFMDFMLPSPKQLEGIPSHMHMTRHVIRSANYSGKYDSVKCFHDTERIKLTHNHFPIATAQGKFAEVYHIEVVDGQMQHYRPNCQSFITDCYESFQKHTVSDPTIWRYKDELIKRVTRALAELGVTGGRYWQSSASS